MSEDQPGSPPIPDKEVVQFTVAEWDRRAGVARTAQDELVAAVASLDGVAQHNVYGDCVEGWTVHTRVKAFVEGLRATWSAQAAQAGELADQCHAAGQRLEELDALGWFPP